MVSSGMPELGVEKILIRRNKAKKYSYSYQYE